MLPFTRTYMTQKVIFAIIFQISLTYLVILKMTPEMVLYCRSGRQLSRSCIEAGHRGRWYASPILSNLLLFDWPVLVNMIRFIIIKKKKKTSFIF